MNIISTNVLNEKQISEIEKLQSKCYLLDGLKNKAYLSNEINFDKELPCFFLGFEEGVLVSFLTIFAPMVEEAEIIAFTDPNYRKKGYFTSLFNEAGRTMRDYKIISVLFQIEPSSKSGADVLEKFINAKLVRSEYTLSSSGNNINIGSPSLILEKANLKNKKILLEITGKVFNILPQDSENFINNAIESEDRDAYIAYLDSIPVGTFNLNFIGDSSFLYGVGIIPYYQGNGYGKELLGRALDISFKRANRVILDVDSDNPPAYNLYMNNGFIVDFQVDYYKYYL